MESNWPCKINLTGAFSRLGSERTQNVTGAHTQAIADDRMAKPGIGQLDTTSPTVREEA